MSVVVLLGTGLVSYFIIHYIIPMTLFGTVMHKGRKAVSEKLGTKVQDLPKYILCMICLGIVMSVFENMSMFGYIIYVSCIIVEVFLVWSMWVIVIKKGVRSYMNMDDNTDKGNLDEKQ